VGYGSSIQPLRQNEQGRMSIDYEGLLMAAGCGEVQPDELEALKLQMVSLRALR
jgi:hypothetical protein